MTDMCYLWVQQQPVNQGRSWGWWWHQGHTSRAALPTCTCPMPRGLVWRRRGRWRLEVTLLLEGCGSHFPEQHGYQAPLTPSQPHKATGGCGDDDNNNYQVPPSPSWRLEVSTEERHFLEQLHSPTQVVEQGCWPALPLPPQPSTQGICTPPPPSLPLL